MMTMSRRVVCLMMGTLLATTTCHTMAGDAPLMLLQMKRGLQADNIKDGMRLGRGILVTHEIHAGFRLWSDAQNASSQPGHYVLSGKQNNAHQLHIRLVPQNIEATDKSGSTEIVLNTGANRMIFYVLADGDQEVAADIYALNVSEALLPP